MRWFKVSDKKPKVGEEVLCYWEYSNEFDLTLIKRTPFGTTLFHTNGRDTDPTHWARLYKPKMGQ